MDYFRVTAWRERGEICAKYLTKGKKVCVIGPVSVRTWESQDGKYGANMEVTVDEIEFLSPAGEQKQAQQPKKVDKQTGMEQVEMADGELPF